MSEVRKQLKIGLREVNNVVDRASMKVGGIEKYEFVQFGKEGMYFGDQSKGKQANQTNQTNQNDKSKIINKSKALEDRKTDM